MSYLRYLKARIANTPAAQGRETTGCTDQCCATCILHMVRRFTRRKSTVLVAMGMQPNTHKMAVLVVNYGISNTTSCVGDTIVYQ